MVRTVHRRVHVARCRHLSSTLGLVLGTRIAAYWVSPIRGRGTPARKGRAMKKSMGAKTILYPTPVLVVGTYDAEGRANAMTAAWGGVACSKPPCVSVSLRAATASHGNIMARHAFTISLPGEANVAEADYCGIVSGRDHDKFAELGLTAVRSDLVDAPYIAEFPLVLECTVVAVHELGLHTQFIGEVRDVKVDEHAPRCSRRHRRRTSQPDSLGDGAERLPRHRGSRRQGVLHRQDARRRSGRPLIDRRSRHEAARRRKRAT